MGLASVCWLASARYRAWAVSPAQGHRTASYVPLNWEHAAAGFTVADCGITSVKTIADESMLTRSMLPVQLPPPPEQYTPYASSPTHVTPKL
jgi:hypothetical protein